MIKQALGDWLALFFVLAVIYMLVRPSSRAAQLVDAVSSMLVSMVNTATDIAKE